ncbi:Transcriptional activator [Ceratobasidium sp. 394]|nr:Transcriptional activator [Ceratobasidium sp. 394]
MASSTAANDGAAPAEPFFGFAYGQPPVEYPDEPYAAAPNPSTPGSGSYSDDVNEQQPPLLRLHAMGLPHQHPHLPPHSHLPLDPSLIPLTHPAAATAYTFHQQHKRTASSTSAADGAVKRRRSDAAVLNSAGLHPPPEYLPSPSTVSVSELEYPQQPPQPTNDYGPTNTDASAVTAPEYAPPPQGEFAPPYNGQEYTAPSQNTIVPGSTSEQPAMPVERQPGQEDADTLDEEPLYVNAKQYHRILKRRTARARLEEVHRLSKERKVSYVQVGIACSFIFVLAVLARVETQACHAPSSWAWRAVPHC